MDFVSIAFGSGEEWLSASFIDSVVSCFPSNDFDLGSHSAELGKHEDSSAWDISLKALMVFYLEMDSCLWMSGTPGASVFLHDIYYRGIWIV